MTDTLEFNISVPSNETSCVPSDIELQQHVQFTTDFGILKNALVGGCLAKPEAYRRTQDQDRQSCKSLIQVFCSNEKNGHFAIFIAVFRLRHDWRGCDRTAWDRLKKCCREFRSSYLLLKCTELIDNINQSHQKRLLDINQAVDLTALELYAEFLDVQIIVYKSEAGNSRQNAELFFTSKVRKTQDQTIFLEILAANTSNHFNVISNIAGVLEEGQILLRVPQRVVVASKSFLQIGLLWVQQY